MSIGTITGRIGSLVVGLAIPVSICAQDTTVVPVTPQLRSAITLPQNQVLITTPELSSQLHDQSVVDALQRGQPVVTRSADTARSVAIPGGGAQRAALRLPWSYYVPDEPEGPDGGVTPATSPSVIHAQPVTWADGPLTFNPTTRRFEGTVSLFLQDSVSPSRSSEVAPPFAIVLTSDADSLDRTQIALARTGFPPERVRLASRHPGDSVRIDIRTPSDAIGIPLHVPVRPSVVIETPPRAVPGWGVGEFRVTVELHGPLPDRDVRLRPSIRGVVDSSGVDMGRGRATQITIQSQGLGPASLSIAADGFVSDAVEFRYVFPFWFVGLGVLGAILGAGFAVVRSDTDGRGKLFLSRVGLGLAGMLAYFVLGVQIFAIDGSPVPISEIAVLTVALLSALVAPNLVGLLGGRERRGANEA